MSSDSDDDFGDLDFVTSAANKVKKNWTKTYDSPVRENVVLGKKPTSNKDENVVAIKKVKRGKENKVLEISDEEEEDEMLEDQSVVEKKPEEEKISLTPPPSPGSSSTPAGRAVRGANRTKKTQKALEKLQTAKFRQGAMGRLSRNNSLTGDDILLVDDDEEKRMQRFQLKVRWKAEVERVEVEPDMRMGKVMDELASMVGATAGHIVLYKGQEQVKREDTVAGLGLSIVTVLEARLRVDLDEDTGAVEVKLQTSDRRATVLVKMRPVDTVLAVMEVFAEKTGHGLDTLTFKFDGEELGREETAESLELEGGECIDVFVK